MTVFMTSVTPRLTL